MALVDVLLLVVLPLPLDVGSVLGSFLVEEVVASVVGFFFDLDDPVGFFASTLVVLVVVVPLDMAFSEFKNQLPPEVVLILFADDVAAVLL